MSINYALKTTYNDCHVFLYTAYICVFKWFASI